MSPILTLQRQLMEIGRLRMGKKGDRGQPQKLDTWRLTSRDKARLEAVAEQHGGTVQPWKERDGEFEIITATDELPIMLLPGQVLSSWYELWSAGGCQRRCDGEREILTDSPCLCDGEKGERKCKPTTRLSVMLPDIPGLGCWRLESHGWYAATELAATAHMLEQATARGQLLPARLRIDQRSQVKDGKTTRYAVPVIDIDITMREALPMVEQPALQLPPAHKPLAVQSGTGLADGLAVTARQASPAVRTGRSAAELGPPIDAETNVAPIPVPTESVGEPVAVEKPTSLPSPVSQAVWSEPASPTEKPITPAQAKKANVLVGKLRDQLGVITTQHLWQSVGRDIPPEDVDDLHWGPLRDTLTKTEASALIDRLERFLEAQEAAA